MSEDTVETVPRTMYDLEVKIRSWLEPEGILLSDEDADDLMEFPKDLFNFAVPFQIFGDYGRILGLKKTPDRVDIEFVMEDDQDNSIFNIPSIQTGIRATILSEPLRYHFLSKILPPDPEPTGEIQVEKKAPPVVGVRIFAVMYSDGLNKNLFIDKLILLSNTVQRIGIYLDQVTKMIANSTKEDLIQVPRSQLTGHQRRAVKRNKFTT